jgi:Dolichyl-phosphate-mannose-protein mannosyltransferase
LDHRAHALTTAPSAGRQVPAAATTRTLQWLGITILAVAELLWLAWFVVEPLPNSNNVGVPGAKAVRRGLLLLKAFPEVVPDTPWHRSILGQGLDELSHLENLPQRAPIVLTALLIAAAAVGLGDLVLRRSRVAQGLSAGERVAVDYGLGAGLLGVFTLVVGRMGWLDPWVFRVALALVAAMGLMTSKLWRAPRPRLDSWSILLFLLVGPFVLLMLLGAMLPSIDFDVLEYHLQGPKEYYQAGRISFLPHNVYTSMPFDVEMLHLMSMEVLGDWWWGGLAGQLLVAFFAPAAAVLIAGAAARGGSPRAAWLATVVYLSTPWIYRVAVLAYVEGPLSFYHAALIWGVVRSANDGKLSIGRWWGVLGLLAGCAMGCKYPSLISAVIPLGILAIAAAARSRSAAPVLCYVAGWAVVMGPWLGKNVIDTGNPVYPLADSVFHGRHWDAAREAKWSDAHGRRPVTAAELWNSIVDVAGRSDWQSPLYAALAPLALLRPGSRRLALALWLYVVYIFLTWWLLTHRLDRFWLPLLPALAILAGLGGDWSRGRAWALILGMLVTVGLVSNMTLISTALAGLNEWTRDLVTLRRNIPASWNPPLARLDTELPEHAHPLLVGQAAVFHLRHSVAYNTVFDPEIIELLARGKSPEELSRALHARQLTHVYVDWKEIQRHRQPGGYGFTEFVSPSRFAEWVAAGVLERPRLLGAEQELYAVR